MCVCLRILASSRIPQYDLGRQTPHFWGGSVTTSSGHVSGLAAPEINLLCNMICERYEHLTTWPLRKENNVLQQLNLANNLHKLILLGIKKWNKAH
jgi:hypothetical protein